MPNKKTVSRDTEQVGFGRRREGVTVNGLMDEMVGTPSPPPAEKEIVYVPMLAVTEQGIIPARNFQLTPTGLLMEESATENDWETVGAAIFRIEGASQWLIGDWLNYGEVRFKHPLEQIASLLNRDPKTLQNYSWVASSLPHSLRREMLSFGHHMLVAGDRLPEVEKDRWLGEAERYGWTVNQMRQAMKKKRSKGRRAASPMMIFQKRVLRLFEKSADLFTAADTSEKREMAEALQAIVDRLKQGL